MKKQDLVIFFVSIVVICVNTIALSKNDYETNAEGTAQIAKAIIEIEKDDLLEKQIDEKSFPLEYRFTVHNFRDDLINEADFDYQIEIEQSHENFPVSYTLWDCDKEVYLDLTDGKSEVLKLATFAKESRRFCLKLQWQEMDEELAADTQINLKINAVQARKGEINEISENSDNFDSYLDAVNE